MPLRVFGSRNLSAANVIQGLSVAGMFAMFFLGALYLERVLGYGALEIGLAFLPVTLIMGTLSLRYSEALMTRFGARTTLLPGLALIMAGPGCWSSPAPVDGTYAQHVLPVMVLLGTGAGLAFPALMSLATADATPADAGLASGLVNTSAQVGRALGLAVIATLAATETGRLRAGGDSAVAALNDCYHLAYLIGAGLLLVCVVVAAVWLTPPDGAGVSCRARKPGPAGHTRTTPAVTARKNPAP